MAGIGHNGGPALAAGAAWRRHCWTKARADLLPVLPLPVVRRRVRRAAEIGLDYRTYATVRASTGRDIVAILFSTNALRLFRADQKLAADRAARLAGMRDCTRTALVVPPLTPGQFCARGLPLDHLRPAPAHLAPWAEQRRLIAAAHVAPADAVLLVGALALEREWCAAGRLAGYLDADRYFAAGS